MADNDAIDYINRDIVNVKNELHVLSKLVRDGNGQPSLLQQAATLNSDVSRLEKEIKNEITNLHNSIEGLKDSIERKAALNWQFKTALTVALIASFTSIFVHFNGNNTNIEKEELKLQREELRKVIQDLNIKLNNNSVYKK